MSLVGQISRLTTVSKVLYEQELLAIRQENEALKLSLFWTKHSVQKLGDLMSCASQCHPEAPNCTCVSCICSGRSSEDNVSIDRWTCTFKPWFEQKLAQCQLECGYILSDSKQESHECDHNLVWDVNAHLIYVGRDDWHAFTYGARLYKATHINDPELLKLTKLFEILDQDANDDLPRRQ